jgi:hypothetical protein
MAFVFKRLALSMSIAAALAGNNLRAGDKEPPKLEIGPAASYAAHQTISQVTIGADVYVSDEKARPPFGKNNPYQFGVLPVLLVIQNGSQKTIRLDQMRVEYVAPGGGKVQPTPPGDVKYARGPEKPELITGPAGTPRVRRPKKNPLDQWAIEGRAFAAKMVPPGESASGFFYFQTGFQRRARLYLTGLREADSGTELFYFEIPLENADSATARP